MGAWVTDNTSTKRHLHYITSAAVRAADGSVGVGLAWAAMRRAGKGVKFFPVTTPGDHTALFHTGLAPLACTVAGERVAEARLQVGLVLLTLATARTRRTR